MKAKNAFQILLVSLVLISCKNEKSTDATPATAASTESTGLQNFRVTMNVVAKADDNFQVYYSEMPQENFSEEKSVWKNLAASNDAQDVMLDLPGGVLPTSIRLDVGSENTPSDVVINSITLENGTEKFTIQRAEIPTYFSAMEPTKFDPATGAIKNIKDGKKTEPTLQPLPPLVDVLSKITAAK